MSRYLPNSIRLGALAAVIALVGCGKSEEASVASGTPEAAQPGAAQPAAAVDHDAAKDTVAQFLDAVRRGGDAGGAHALLTRQAVQVLESLGRTIQPLGSPDATFTVTRSEPVEEHPTMALVHSTWTEPVADDQTVSYQVVWALQEEQGWKISGLAMELDPEQPPLIVDFEDHVSMAQLFRGDAADQDDAAARTAEAPGQSSDAATR